MRKKDGCFINTQRQAQLVTCHKEGLQCSTSSDELAVPISPWGLIQQNRESGTDVKRGKGMNDNGDPKNIELRSNIVVARHPAYVSIVRNIFGRKPRVAQRSGDFL